MGGDVFFALRVLEVEGGANPSVNLLLFAFPIPLLILLVNVFGLTRNIHGDGYPPPTVSCAT